MTTPSRAIRNFLIRQPPLHSIRLTDANGDISDMVPGRKSKAVLAESIAAKGVDLIECLDRQGMLLRAMRVDEDAVRSSAEVPIVKGLETDPQAAMMSHFANLLHRAYEHATDIAFSKLVELVERMDARTEAIEMRLERTEANFRREQQERIEDLYDRAEEHADGTQHGQRMVETLVASAVQGQQQRGNGKSNGRS